MKAEVQQEPVVRRFLVNQSMWLLVAVAGIALALPLVFQNSYLRHLLVITCIYLTLTISYNLIVGFTGYLTLAHNTFFGVGAYASAIVTATHGESFAVGVLSGLIVTGILSASLGWLLFTRLKGFAFSIVSLGLAITAYIVVLNWVSVTRGPMGIPGVPRPTLALGPTSIRIAQTIQFYYLGLLLVMLAAGITWWVARSRTGRALLSIRENEQLSAASGVNTLKYKLFVFILGSLVASLAGSFYVHYITVATYEVFWTFWITGLLAMLIVGGPGANIVGIVIGTILLVWLPEQLRVVESLRELIYGVALLLIIIFLPQGIGGYIDSTLYQRRLNRWRSSQSRE